MQEEHKLLQKQMEYNKVVTLKSVQKRVVLGEVAFVENEMD
jgi:hypothetical protein